MTTEKSDVYVNGFNAGIVQALDYCVSKLNEQIAVYAHKHEKENLPPDTAAELRFAIEALERQKMVFRMTPLAQVGEYGQLLSDQITENKENLQREREDLDDALFGNKQLAKQLSILNSQQNDLLKVLERVILNPEAKLGGEIRAEVIASYRNAGGTKA